MPLSFFCDICGRVGIGQEHDGTYLDPSQSLLPMISRMPPSVDDGTHVSSEREGTLLPRHTITKEHQRCVTTVIPVTIFSDDQFQDRARNAASQRCVATMMERVLTRATRLSQDTQGAADVLLDSCAVCQMMETLHDRPHGLSTEQGASSVSLYLLQNGVGWFSVWLRSRRTFGTCLVRCSAMFNDIRTSTVRMLVATQS